MNGVSNAVTGPGLRASGTGDGNGTVSGVGWAGGRGGRVEEGRGEGGRGGVVVGRAETLHGRRKNRRRMEDEGKGKKKKKSEERKRLFCTG